MYRERETYDILYAYGGTRSHVYRLTPVARESVE